MNTTKPTVTWASIGCGDVCEKKSLPAMYKLPGSTVAGVFARNQEKARDFARRHSIPKVYGSVAELLADPSVDVVYIATRPDTHHDYTLASLEAGKHVYVEKPMALDFAGCLRMHEKAKQANRKIFLAHYRRGLPYFQKVKNLLEEQAVGKILSVQMELFQPPNPADSGPNLPWRLQAATAGGGYFFDLAPHGLDIVQFVLNDPISDAGGFATNRGGLYEVEDSVTGSFRTRSGILGTAQWSFVAGNNSRLDKVTVRGTEGELSFSVFTFEPIRLSGKEGSQSYNFDNPEHIQQPFIQTILDEIRGEGRCLCTSEEGLPTALAMDKMNDRT